MNPRHEGRGLRLTFDKIVYVSFFTFKSQEYRDRVFKKFLKIKKEGYVGRQHERITFEKFFRDTEYEKIDNLQINFTLILSKEEDYINSIKEKIKNVTDQLNVYIVYEDIAVKDEYISK